MSTPSPVQELPLPLSLLQQTPTGMLYGIASKATILLASNHCDRNIVVRAEWNGPERTVLTLFCVGGVKVTFSADRMLVGSCDCSYWGRAAECPHVVTLWMQLKRLVSAESFPQTKISQQVLRELGRLVGVSGPEPAVIEKSPLGPRLAQLMGRYGVSAADRPVVTRAASQPAATLSRKNVRLVLALQYGRLHGTVRHGSVPINQWSRGLPRDIAAWLQRLPYYESTMEYFACFTAVTNGSCPVVFLHETGVETILTLAAEQPRHAGMEFSLSEGRVAISRTLDNAPVSDSDIPCRAVVIDLTTARIQPLINRQVWEIGETVEDKLLVEDDDEDDYDWDDGDLVEESAAAAEPVGDGVLERSANRLVVTAERFNRLALRLCPDRIAAFDDSVRFLINYDPVSTAEPRSPLYLLELPADLDTPLITLLPLVGFDQHFCSFSGDLFRYFNPERGGYSTPLKARKRVRTLIAACFQLTEVVTPAARSRLIKAALSGPDYIKRAVKRVAKEILSDFAAESLLKPLMIQVEGDGWRFSEDDRQAQIRLVRILHDLFGADAFASGTNPGEMIVGQEELLSQLPLLAEQLRLGGFALRVGGEALSAAAWDFALDATASSQDWFELRPEIRCDGELLSGEELQRLAQGGLLRRDGRLILIDDLSSRVLAMLAGTSPAGNRKKKGAPALVRIPRLQILDWLQLRSHGVTVRLPPADAAILENLLNFAAIPHRELPFVLTATLRPYQRDGYQWLGFLYEHRFGACLADDMGLGKTVQGISLLAGIAAGVIATAAPPAAPHLIVVPPSLLFNWESELARFFPTARVLTYSGQGRCRADFPSYDIILTSYGIVQRDIEALAALRFNVIIYDEAQLVKNLQAATTAAARRLAGSFKLALTGTPVENRLEEYYAIIDLCLPGLLGSPEEFHRSLGNKAQGGIDTLLRRTRPFLLRRNKQLISADLPDKIETDIYLELSPKQKALYQRTIIEVRGRIEEAFANRSPGQARIIALTAILRLRQICLAPVLALEGASDASPKLEFLLEQLLELQAEGHSVLVFSQFTSYLDLVQAGLQRHHLPWLRLDGSTPVSQRRQLVQGFQESAGPMVFLISLKAGGKGLNLTRATYVYHLDPWWNPAVENQASDRAHRIGQTRQVTITRLLMRHTIEEKMMALKEQKLQLYQAILEDGAVVDGAGLTREDFDFLLA